MKATCNSTVTKELKSFLVYNIPEPSSGYWIAVSNLSLARNIAFTTGKPFIAAQIIDHIMRGLRVKIDKLIVGLDPGDLKLAQLNLARCYRRQSRRACKKSSTLQRIYHNVIAAEKVVVVPHKFQGLFIAKGLGKKDYFICTKNLVLGKVLYGDQLISDDRTQVEYRVWNPCVSKLIRVCSITSKTGGHHLISTLAKNINLTSQVKDPFADHEEVPFHKRMEFKTNQLVMLKPIGRGHAMAVGGYRRVK